MTQVGKVNQTLKSRYFTTPTTRKAMVFLLFVLRIRRPSILGFWKKNKIAFTYFFYSRRLP